MTDGGERATLCDAIYGQSGIFESESLYYMLMECPHEALKDWRRDLKKAVVDLATPDWMRRSYRLRAVPRFMNRCYRQL